MVMSDERKEYLRQYRKEKLKRIPIDYSLSYYERLKIVAELTNTTVIKFIKAAVNEALEKNEKKLHITVGDRVCVYKGEDGKHHFYRDRKLDDSINEPIFGRD